MSEARGALLIGADGIHSAIRAQMHPGQGPIHWGGALMWRGTVRAEPLRTGSSFVGLGTGKTRMVIYPISHPDADGRALINWIAEVTVDASDGWTGERWFEAAEVSRFRPSLRRLPLPVAGCARASCRRARRPG
jgi:2-polyprenyl-6-methoxyphenol hydroxylase-like FAD-dependent oxidoreductase